MNAAAHNPQREVRERDVDVVVSDLERYLSRRILDSVSHAALRSYARESIADSDSASAGWGLVGASSNAMQRLCERFREPHPFD